MYISSLEDVGP